MRIWAMFTISFAAARNHFSEVIDRSKSEDVAAFDEAMAEEGSNILWAQVNVDLGWVLATGSICGLLQFDCRSE